jgi:carbon-monoxide dehydrogenase large subunit
MTEQGIGAAVRRKEDYRFITGHGNYTDDINRPGQAYLYVLRSSVAHANIRGIDTRAAAGAPGVIAVFTGQDLAADGIGGLPCGWGVNNKDGSPMAEPPHPVLATGRVRHVGDPVAIVVAETRLAAKDAAEQIAVDYDELPAVATSEDALAPGAPQLHDGARNNVCFDWEIGDRAATDAAFAKATHVARVDLVNNRVIPNAIEPRAYIGEYDVGTGDYTLYTTSQNPHVIRLLMGAFVLKIPEHKLRVVAPDVGGGFGSKIYHYAEEALVTWAARKLGRPVKWTAERSESFMSDAHGRDHVTHAELALDDNARFLALRVSTRVNMGAYLSTFGPAVPTWMHATLLAGVYTTPAIHCEIKAAFTNTVPVDAYRGAGRPEATYLLERVVNVAARELGIDQAELRRRNYIQPDAFPYQTPVGLQYDSGDYEATLDKALAMADYAGFPARRAESQKRGRRRGIGVTTYIEACGAAPSQIAGQLGARAGLYEVATVRVHPTGSVTVLTGSHSHGQGHETAFAQLVNETLGVPIENVEVVHGDTARIPFGMGTYGSRSLAVGGVALAHALTKIVEKGKQIAAHLLEAGAGDIVLENGTFKVAGTDVGKSFGEIAFAAYVPHKYPLERLEPGLEETAFYDPKNFTYPAGTHVCELEVDPETGEVEILAYTVVDDFGRVVNPMIVEGQVHGGLAQGIGQALHEQCIYDRDSAQLVSGSYMDYCMPRAHNFPKFTVGTTSTLCTHNVLGVKGCGEAGTIGSPPTVINALIDALEPLGVKDISMPATPRRVWEAIQTARTA